MAAKAAVHGAPQKAFSKNASDENERWRWDMEMYQRKNADVEKNNHYDYSRHDLNFEIVKGEIKKLGFHKERLHKRLQKKLMELGFKSYKDDAQNKPNCCVDWVFSGDHDRMCEMAFGDAYKSIDFSAEKDNTEALKNTSIYKFFHSEKNINLKGKIQEPDIYKWAKDVYRFACKKWGEENIIGMEVHLDETTPHAHILMVPVALRKTRGRASTKYEKKSDPSIIIKKSEYEALPDNEKADYQKVSKTSKALVSYSGVFGDNYTERKEYMKKFHTEFFEEVGKKYGLERGDDLDLLDPEERRKRRHMRKDQLHAVQEHEAKVAELQSKIAEETENKNDLVAKNDELTKKKNELEESVQAHSDKLEQIKYEYDEAQLDKWEAEDEISNLQDEINEKNNLIQELQAKIASLPSVEELNEREKRNRELPTVEELNEREERDKSLPSLKDIIDRENRNKRVPSLDEIIERENRDKAVPSIDDIIQREERSKELPSLEEIIERENKDKAVPSYFSIKEREDLDKSIPSMDELNRRKELDETIPSDKQLEERRKKAFNLPTLAQLNERKKKYDSLKENMYQGLSLPDIDEEIEVSIEESNQGNMCVFAKVNGEWLNGKVLSKEQLDDYNNKQATKEQLAAMLLSSRILDFVRDKEKEKCQKIKDETQEAQTEYDKLVSKFQDKDIPLSRELKENARLYGINEGLNRTFHTLRRDEHIKAVAAENYKDLYNDVLDFMWKGAREAINGIQTMVKCNYRRYFYIDEAEAIYRASYLSDDVDTRKKFAKKLVEIAFKEDNSYTFKLRYDNVLNQVLSVVENPSQAVVLSREQGQQLKR